MINYTIRWANRSNSDQDWIISNGDNFELMPNYVRSAAVRINNNYTWQLVVSTDGGNAAASLTYNASTQAWAINSHTPNEWALQAGNGIVTVRCFLDDVNDGTKVIPSYEATNPKLDVKGLN